MPTRRSLLLAAALLALSPSVPAAVDLAPGSCPVDGTDVQISVLLSTNALLGHDRDLCPHASGDDEVRHAISACSTCGFAGTPREFKQPVPEEIVARIKKELKPATTAWERYANRARIQEWSEAPAPMIGESWLRAAWSVRLDERSAPPALAETIQRLLAALPQPERGKDVDVLLAPARALDAKLAQSGALSGADRAVARYASGAFWRTRGELAEAEQRYAQALAEAKGTPVEKALAEVIARDRGSIELETGYLKKALGYFRAALAAGEKVPAEQRTMLAFLAAECARRSGNREEAQRLYKIAQALAGDATGNVKALVEQGLADTAPAKKKKASKQD